jgi:WD40 repeat protein
MAEMDEGFRAMGVGSDEGLDRATTDVDDDENDAPSGALRGESAAQTASSVAASYPPSVLAANWFASPVSQQGAVTRLSDRPLVCADVDALGAKAYVGGTDHAVYEVDVKTCKKLRTLYTKTHGHKEWVTQVRCLPDGRVLSSGMDSLLCLWDARGTRCSVLEGHNGSVSNVAVGGSGLTAVSAGYDKTLKLWNLAPKGFTARSDRCVGTLRGHTAPVTTLAWGEGRETKTNEEKNQSDDAGAGGLGSGDRDGVVMLWDAGSGAAVGRRGGHRGHVTSLAWIDGGGGGAVLLSGGQDGKVHAWDPRVGRVLLAPVPIRPRSRGARRSLRTFPGASLRPPPGFNPRPRRLSTPTDAFERHPDVRLYGTTLSGTSPVASVAAHVQKAGTGAVGDIVQTVSGAVVTAGADGHVAVIDPRAGFALRGKVACGDFVYSLAAIGPLALAGTGAGGIHVIDIDVTDGPKTLYGLGANEAAVRCVYASKDWLFAAGDDGTCISYAF